MDEPYMYSKGDKIGDNYTIIGHLGQGGMADVYLVRDPVDLTFALKVMRLGELENEEDWSSEERWKREARSQFRVRHDNVVGIYGAGKIDKRPYIVMEYIEGRSLAERVAAEAPIEPGETARIGAGIARGLEAIHKAGFIHRDLKPANVLLEENTGTPKITDFGIVREEDSAGLTEAGQLFGSLGYIAPERFIGIDLTACDIYSLGAILYRTATGKKMQVHPTALESLTDVINHHKENKPKPIAKIIGGEAKSLSQVVESLLDPDPDKRPNATEAAYDLERVWKSLSKNEQTCFIPRTGLLQSRELLTLQRDACDSSVSDFDFLQVRGPVVLLLPPAYEQLTGKVVERKLYGEIDQKLPPVLITNQKFRRKKGLTIGRAAQSEIRVDNEKVSRRHTRIIYAVPDRPSFSVRDCGSSNGTYVNGVRISRIARVHHGQVLGFGPEVAYVFAITPTLRGEIREKYGGEKISLDGMLDEEKPTRIVRRRGTTKKDRRDYSGTA